MDNNLIIEELDFLKIKDTFVHELSCSLQKKKTSLPFIENPLSFNSTLIKDNESFQIFVIGGTNGIIATVQKSSKNIKIISKKSISLVDFFSTIEGFFAFIESYLNPKVRVIGINFAFGLKPIVTNGVLDGILIGGDPKGHMFNNIKNIPIGEQITAFFKEKGKTLIVSVVNDAICLLLSSYSQNLNPATTGAYIVGTGSNLAFYLTPRMAINTQASDFSNFQQTTTGKIIDTQSINPGKQVFAKEIAGELYRHFNLLCQQLNLQIHPLNSTEELNNLAYKNNSRGSLLAQKLIQRSARLAACQIAGFYEFKKRPAQMHLIIEGSLFLKGFCYKEFVEEQLTKFGIAPDSIIFEEILDSNIYGISKLLVG